MMSTQENRRSFRVSESVYLKFEILSEDDYRDGIARRNLRSGSNDGMLSRLVDIDARLSEAMYLLNGEQGALGRCITLLNDKLNIVVNELPGLRETKSSLANVAPQTCDVSADGIVFSSERPLSIGDKLHLKFLLSADNRYIESFCEVVRLTEPPDTGAGNMPYGIAVEFTNMPKAQREMIIQHMFTRESETLRMRRLELESPPDRD
jgi:hypothetical protein